MVQTEIVLTPGFTDDRIRVALCEILPIKAEEITEVRLLQKTLVTESRPTFLYRLRVGFSAAPEKEAGLLKMRKKVFPVPDLTWYAPKKTFSFRPVVIGAGPAGLFAALTLAEAGTCPLLIEQGDPVDARTEKVRAFRSGGALDEQSNVAFGEGGAGTFSDGKLKVGGMDRNKWKVLTEFVTHGAPEEILYDAMPHVGTDRLSGVVRGIREKILSLGGTVYFRTKVTDLTVRGDRVTGVVLTREDGTKEQISTEAVLLATGHSAKDMFSVLEKRGAAMEPKGFGIGMRIEHPRAYIDGLMYGDAATADVLGTASYHLVTHLSAERSVYSFCMCPGGEVVAAASDREGIVTNGMSTYRRDGANSNAAILVSVTPKDFGTDEPLGGLAFQEKIEKAAFRAAGGTSAAPCVRLGDFLSGKESTAFGDVLPTYPRGTVFVPPRAYLPDFVTQSMRAAFADFDRWLPGFSYSDAVLTGPETRTTSPVRIMRRANGTAVGIHGLYPCGEGAGYAGGIISSAADGIREALCCLAAYSC